MADKYFYIFDWANRMCFCGSFESDWWKLDCEFQDGHARSFITLCCQFLNLCSLLWLCAVYKQRLLMLIRRVLRQGV